MSIRNLRNTISGGCPALKRLVQLVLFLAAVVAGAGTLTPSARAQTTPTSVTLTWTAKGDDGSAGVATQYDVRYSTSAITDANWGSATQVSGEPTPKTAGQAETLTVAGLAPSTTYFFALKIADEIPNWSALSNVVSRTTLAETTAPAAIANLTLGMKTAYTIAMSWTSPGDDGSTGTAAQYDLRYSTSAITAANFGSAAQITGLPAPKAAGGSENFTASGLTPNTTYYFAIKTADEVPNWSAISNVPSGATIQETIAPATISNLGTGNETSTSIRLTWTAPGDDGNIGTAAQYDVRYSTSAITAANFNSATAATGEPAPSAPGTAEAFTATGLNANTTYYFAVKAADEVPNWSAISNVVSRATLPEQNPPANVSTLAATNPSPNSVVLTWTAVGDDGATGTATQYEIRYSTAPITAANFGSATLVSTPPVPKISGSAESFLVTGLTPGTTYYFALKVADEVPNWSGLSNVASQSTTTVDNTPPDPVNDLTAAPGANIGEILLGWHATGDDRNIGTARVYEIRYSQNPLNATNFGLASMWITPPVPAPAGTPQSVILAGLAAGQRYNVAMKVYDDAGNVSSLSNVSSALAQLKLETSTDEIATLVSPPQSSVVLSSRPTLVVDNLLSGSSNMYYFEVATDSNFIGMAAFGSALEEADGQTEWRVDQPLQSELTYYWRVRANSFDYSEISSFTVLPQTHAYPNPFRPSQATHTTFTDIPQGSNLEMISVSGDPVRQWSNVTDEIRWDGTNASGQPVASGVYLWAVGGTSLQGKIIVIR